ncbi:hypothetical protein [Streptomyces flavovirens]
MTGNSSEFAEGRSPRPGGVVRLYPAAYRRQHGAEIAATLADIADAEGRWGVRRETAAVAGHALRMRTGLGSARPAGRALAGLTPYVVAVAASLSAALLVVWPLEPQAWDGERTYTPLAYAPWLAVLGCLIAGRWAWARISAAGALAGAALSVPLALWSGGREGLSQNLPTVLGLAVAATAVLAAPPDLPPTAPRARRNATLTALALGVPLLVASTTVFQAVAGPGVVESARPEPVRVLLRFAPLVSDRSRTGPVPSRRDRRGGGGRRRVRPDVRVRAAGIRPLRRGDADREGGLPHRPGRPPHPSRPEAACHP